MLAKISGKETRHSSSSAGMRVHHQQQQHPSSVIEAEATTICMHVVSRNSSGIRTVLPFGPFSHPRISEGTISE
eukprot:5714893-Amphidinium_carterae.2